MLHILGLTVFHLELRDLLAYFALGQESLRSFVYRLKLTSGSTVTILSLSDLAVLDIETQQPVPDQILASLRRCLFKSGQFSDSRFDFCQTRVKVLID